MTERATPARRLLVVTDLGPTGLTAIRVAVARAAHGAGRLAILHTMPDLRMSRPLWTNLVAPDALYQATFPEQVRALLLEHVAEAGAPDDAEVFLEVGTVAASALEVADRWGADELVTASPDGGAVDVQRIVRHAAVPVYVARTPLAAGPIVACTDFSDPSLPAISAAADEARRTRAPLHVVHVLEPLPLVAGVDGYGVVAAGDWSRARHQDAERRASAAFAAAGVDGTYAVVEGGVVHAILGEVEAKGAALLVLGTVGRTGLTRFLLGSVAEDLVQRAPCSLLVVRLHRDRGEAAR